MTGWISDATTCYTIAFTLRSGSNVLCDLLAANGIGAPTEYFQHPLGVANEVHYRELGVPVDDFRAFLTGLLAKKSPNGIFGAKVTWDHRNVLCEAVRRHFGRCDGFAAFSPRHRWIFLRRRDKIGQAISLLRAVTSGTWSSLAPTSGRTPTPAYDFFRLLGILQSIVTEEYLWEDFFEQSRIEPIRIIYEDLVREPAATVFRVARAVQEAAGVELVRSEADVVPGTTFAVQRDARSAELAASFRDDVRRLGLIDHWRSRADELARWLRFFNEEGWKEG